MPKRVKTDLLNPKSCSIGGKFENINNQSYSFMVYYYHAKNIKNCKNSSLDMAKFGKM